MARASKIRASKLPFQSISQLTLAGFETPFEQKLSQKNRWVVLANRIPWDEIVGVYDKQMRNHVTGASHVNGRVVIGALVIKHLCNLSDEETILQIQENMYMQYFIGYSSFSVDVPFDSSLFVEIRKRLGLSEINAINEKIYEISKAKASQYESTDKNDNEDDSMNTCSYSKTEAEVLPKNEGRLLVDASACPQDIAYPTDLNILNDAREKSEILIDSLYKKELHGELKPRTYREKARKLYLNTAQKKIKSKREIRNALGKQLRFLRRNIKTIHRLLEGYNEIPLNKGEYKYLLVIQEVLRQQQEMRNNHRHSIEHRIVSIHQPHVRPIVRGKTRAKTEFGSKLHLSLCNGFAFVDYLSWDAYNEGSLLLDSVEQYRRRHGHYPEEVLADQIYCSRENRRELKELGIKLLAKPLGRPSAVKREHVRPGERNPIEGKFGQAKTAYGLDRIKARLNATSESWIASIILVLNLVKLTRQASIALFQKIWKYVLSELFLKQEKILLFQ